MPEPTSHHTRRSLPHATITLDQPGDLIAALPYVLCFHPVDSLVAIGLHHDDATALGVATRVDLPAPVDPATLAEGLLAPVVNAAPAGAALIVIGARGDTRDAQLPHRDLITACAHVLTSAGIRVVQRLWTPDITAGARWRCYEDLECGGIVPDPSSTTLAATAAAGQITYHRRDELTALLAPVDEDILSRRAELLTAASRDAEPGSDPARARDRLRLLDEAVDRAVDGVLPQTDDEVTALAFALTDLQIRDACLAQNDPGRAAAAERLWITLVRGTPAPERAEPACLLAYSAYCRGDGVQAGIALDQAEPAQPGHRLAELTRNALSVGLPPERMRRAAAQARAHARRVIAGESGIS